MSNRRWRWGADALVTISPYSKNDSGSNLLPGLSQTVWHANQINGAETKPSLKSRISAYSIAKLHQLYPNRIWEAWLFFGCQLQFGWDIGIIYTETYCICLKFELPYSQFSMSQNGKFSISSWNTTVCSINLSYNLEYGLMENDTWASLTNMV